MIVNSFARCFRTGHFLYLHLRKNQVYGKILVDTWKVRRFMKKIISVLLIIATVFTLPACGVNSESGATQPATQPETTKPSTPVETHEHSYTTQVVAPTCTDDGYTVYLCSCEDSYVSDKVAATGHNYGDWVTTLEPTETTTGAAERKCSVCYAVDTRILGMVISDHVHSYTSEVVAEASCTAEGQKRFSCTCGESYTESTEKLPHSYQSTLKEPTCLNGGYTTHTCAVCEDSYVDTMTDPLGHTYGNDHKCIRCSEKDPAGYTTYTVTVRSDKGVLIAGVTVDIYVGETKVGSGVTDKDGVVKTEISTTSSNGYKIVLSNVPAAYEAKASYTFISTKATINLKTVPVLDPNDHSQAMYTVGSTMANFVLTDVDGNVYDLSQLRQEYKLIILDFWYVNCVPCKKEFPYFEALLKQYGDDVILLAVNNIDSAESILNLRETLGQDPATAVTFPMIVDTLGLTEGFGVTSYPLTAFIDSSGKIVYVHPNAFSSEADFLAQVGKFLK